MPDWSYRTLFRPVFFHMPSVLARNLCLGVVGTLARFPLGSAVIDLLGHMRPDPRLARTMANVPFRGPVGLGAGIDVTAYALRALSRFGFSLLEIGPVTLQPRGDVGRTALRRASESVWYPDDLPSPGLTFLADRLRRADPLSVPLLARLAVSTGLNPTEAAEEIRQLIERLSPHVRLFALCPPATAFTSAHNVASGGHKPPESGHSGGLHPPLASSVGRSHEAEAWWETCLRRVQAERDAHGGPGLLVCLPPTLDPEVADRLLAPAVDLGFVGALVAGVVPTPDGGCLLGKPAWESTLRLVRHLKHQWGERISVIASGGIHEPQDALDMLAAGSDLVLVDSGLVYGGPGLPKRINEAVLSTLETQEPAVEEGPAPRRSWFWATLLGVGMTLGSGLALAIAATRVVLPYDEAFVGMSRAELHAVNDRLLAFMAHDRVTLAGTMVTIGVLYCFLAAVGMRRGRHWAGVALFASAFAGFASFFLFLGFGYFDPFHAFVTVTLLQLLLLAVHADPVRPGLSPPADYRESGAWRSALWGQLLFVTHAATLIAAGLVISTVGCTQVFVAEDLAFMRTTAETLAEANPRLVPLVAHDRATFGGMLCSSGIALLLSSLWGIRRGEAWLWWAFLFAGIPAYVAAIGVHLVVGYTDLWHLTPAYAGLLAYGLGLGLTSRYLLGDR